MQVKRTQNGLKINKIVGILSLKNYEINKFLENWHLCKILLDQVIVHLCGFIKTYISVKEMGQSNPNTCLTLR